MITDAPFDDVLTKVTMGHLRDAREDLLRSHSSRRVNSLAADALLADLDLQLGFGQVAASRAEAILGDSRAGTDETATAHRILAEVHANELAFERSLTHFEAARQAYRRGAPAALVAAVELSFWKFFLGILPLEAAASEFRAVRTAVLRSGQPHHLVELRLCTARVEARKNCLVEAHRHLECAQRLLRAYPNAKLQAQSHLDACMLHVLRADWNGALEEAEQALRAAEISGHYRSRVGALIDSAHVLHAKGETARAQQLAERAVAESAGMSQLRVAALDCLANVLLSLGDVNGAEAAFDKISELRPQHGTQLAPHWDVLSELSSRVSLARLTNRTSEIDSLIKQALETARRSRDETWRAKMEVEWANRLVAAGKASEAVEPLTSAVSYNNPSPELLARTSAAMGLAALEMGDCASGTSALLRGVRVAAALGSPVLESELRPNGPLTIATPGRPSLDDAVALIELAGYPHVLAREAYALLQLTGAASALALVARGPAGARRVDSQGWTDKQAVNAAQHPESYLRITCGEHRDETWEILAELKPTLADRCAGVAVRKLVDAAVTLDRYRREEKQRDALWPADTLETDGGLWVSEQMTELLSIGRRIAPSDITVLLTGETGTGKEVLARAIHRASGRAGKPFVPFNCTAVPHDMLESQLFGYRRGAFTGAEAAFDGVIRGAAGGTLFLDEIAEIGPDLQPKLLRFLETHEVHGLGEAHPVAVDVRVIGATNANLETLLADGRFREDLFYRLNVVRLRVPPLRERREEIPPLIDHYLHRFAEEQKKGRLTLNDEAMEYLLLFAWPGNVRQLVNEIRRLVAMAEPDSTITAALLSPEIQTSRRTVRLAPGDEPEIRLRLDQPLNDAVDVIERALVRRALERAKGNYENAARLLGISRKGLFLKRRRWGMQRAS